MRHFQQLEKEKAVPLVESSGGIATTQSTVVKLAAVVAVGSAVGLVATERGDLAAASGCAKRTRTRRRGWRGRGRATDWCSRR